jgi:hypothetical protein
MAWQQTTIRWLHMAEAQSGLEAIFQDFDRSSEWFGVYHSARHIGDASKLWIGENSLSNLSFQSCL